MLKLMLMMKKILKLMFVSFALGSVVVGNWLVCRGMRPFLLLFGRHIDLTYV